MREEDVQISLDSSISRNFSAVGNGRRHQKIRNRKPRHARRRVNAQVSSPIEQVLNFVIALHY